MGARGLLLALLVVFSLVISAVLFDYWSARRELVKLSRDHAEHLSSVIEQSGANAIVSMAEIENLLLDRLLTVVRSVTGASSGVLGPTGTRRVLGELGASESLDAVVLWRGRRVEYAWPDTVPGSWLNWDPALDSLQQGQEREFADFFSSWDGDWYRAGARLADGSILVVGYDARRLLELRRLIGVGTMIRRLARGSDVEYIALQDTIGIIAATENVRSLSRIESDPELMNLLRGGGFLWRQSTFRGERVFEAVRPFPMGDGGVALLRVGVSQAALRSAQQRMVTRVLVSTLVLLFAGALAFAYLWTQQLAAETQRSYQRIRGLSSGILDRMGDGVVAVDAEGRIQWINPAARRILKLSSGAGADRIAEKAPGVHELLEEVRRRRLPLEERELVCRLDGKERVLIASASLLTDENGDVETVFAVFRDITERVRLERQLAQERRLTAMGQLASGIAHEIRNPLNAISVIAQRLAREFSPRGDEDAEEYAALTDTLVTETRRVNQIVQQFLEFARPPKPDKRPVDLNTVIRESVNLMRSSAEQKGIRLEFEQKSPVVLELDPGQLKQALVNLIQNAVQVCGENDVVRIGLEADDEEARVTVEDTGPGIEPEVLPRIFDLYFTTRPEGTGIGLSLVHRIVSVHGGSIDVESRVGEGTTFVLRFPRGAQG